MHPTPNDYAITPTVNQRIRFAAAYSVLQQAIDNRAFPGAVFGVLFNGSVLALDGIGRFTYAPDSPPVTPETVYDLASLTKVVATTAAAMLLYDQGILDLDQPLGDVLPAFVIGDASASVPTLSRCRVTFRTLLAHSSGLPGYARLFAESPSPAALLGACLRMPLEAEPGARSEYSDIGFILLGKALEILAGESLDSFCSHQIFAPLGLPSIRYQPPRAWRPLIPPTVDDVQFRHRIIQGEVHDENCSVLGGVSGHAGLFANGLDILRFAACIISAGRTSTGQQLFLPQTVKLFSSRQTLPQASSRALGWDTPSAQSSSGHHFGPHAIGHLGYTGTSLWIDLEKQLGVVLLTNRTWPDRSADAIRNVRPEFHDAIFDGLTLT